jgi:hypothetical protein
MADAVLARIEAEEGKGVPLQEFVESAFVRTRQRLTGYSLSIRPVASGCEYLLGVCPAVGIAEEMDPRRRLPLFEAKALIMPLGTRFAAMVYLSGTDKPKFRPTSKLCGRLTTARSRRRIGGSTTGPIAVTAKLISLTPAVLRPVTDPRMCAWPEKVARFSDSRVSQDLPGLNSRHAWVPLGRVTSNGSPAPG